MDTVTAAIFDWVERVEAKVEKSLVKQAEVQVFVYNLWGMFQMKRRMSEDN